MGLGIKSRIKIAKKLLPVIKDAIEMRPSLERRTLVLCHALEKGMGMPTEKSGYGKEKAKALLDNLKELKAQRKETSYEYQEALTIMKSYIDFQEERKVNVDEIKEEVLNLYETTHLRCTGGYEMLSFEDEFSKGSKIDYLTFVRSRHSMRTYAEEEVKEEEINKVISLAKKAPSACNRQPWKFYYSLNKETNKKIMAAIPTQPFLETIPYFGVVTVNRNLFGEDEIYQWFINGGIFLSHLVLAFHSQGIGSCIFQFPVYSEKVQYLKASMQIPDNESIIAIVGYGKYPKEAKCIMADRRKDDEIAIKR